MLINVFIFIWAGFVFGPEQAMYSFMTYYIAMKTIDAVIQGLDETKAVIIVSDQYDEISDAILHRLGRGTTKLKGKGGYTDEEKDVIYAVVTRLEVTKLKSIVFEVDQNAFITIMNTHETRGGKFKTQSTRLSFTFIHFMGIILSAVKKMACWSDSRHFLFIHVIRS